MKCPSSSAEESLSFLQHFGGILDHAIKIVTTIGLLVGLQVIRLGHPLPLVQIMFWALLLAFFFYILRIFEHTIIFFVDKYEWIDTKNDIFRWGRGRRFLCHEFISGFQGV